MGFIENYLKNIFLYIIDKQVLYTFHIRVRVYKFLVEKTPVQLGITTRLCYI